MAQERFLIALNYPHEITSALLHDCSCGLHLSMEGLHQGNGALQVQSIQQGLTRRDRVALVVAAFRYLLVEHLPQRLGFISP